MSAIRQERKNSVNVCSVAIGRKKLHNEGQRTWRFIHFPLPVDVFSKFDRSKENNTSKCIAKEQEEHANDDEEALVHTDDHSQ